MIKPIRILFTNWVDVDNFNAQSLNVREIACRLDSERFLSTLFYAKEPDPRLVHLPHVRLIKIPRRLGTIRVLVECVKGHDIMFSPPLNRIGYLYFRIPEFLRKRTTTIQWIEADIAVHLKDVSHSIKKIFDATYNRRDFYVATTEYVAERAAIDYGIHASQVICTGVDSDVFYPPESRTSSPLRVLFVGHLIERKGPQWVLKAASICRDLKFVLVGEKRGEFYKKLLRMVEDERLNNVTFLQPMSQFLLAKLMAESHILLHPALVESPGKVIMEAAATGLPAIIFSQYRSPAVVDGVTGFQVDDFEEMIARLKLLSNNDNLRRDMGEAAVAYMRQFDWKFIVKEWEKVFERVLTEKRGNRLAFN